MFWEKNSSHIVFDFTFSPFSASLRRLASKSVIITIFKQSLRSMLVIPSILPFQIIFDTQLPMNDLCNFTMCSLVLLLGQLWTHTHDGLQFFATQTAQGKICWFSYIPRIDSWRLFLSCTCDFTTVTVLTPHFISSLRKRLSHEEDRGTSMITVGPLNCE